MDTPDDPTDAAPPPPAPPAPPAAGGPPWGYGAAGYQPPSGYQAPETYSAPSMFPAPAGYGMTGESYYVLLPGFGNTPVGYGQLQQMALAGSVRADTMVQRVGDTYPVPARMVPGVFSDKEYLTAILLSIFLGGLGIDRFYLGHTGLGVAKLLTLGGCGVWHIIDVVLIAMRQVRDIQGRPLS